ncbi:hypothetical protein [Diaphorobacter sp. J5-51]|uniref:hypothetical protein n=1 Tax=Diaphorobacter sp. J5-51 TaxID=680496 RepID=UPI0012FCCEB3|nr:hypothetical protein [Diaphorobacter sp. J5-51]
MKLNIPEGITFDALELRYCELAGFEYNADILAIVCAASGLSPDGVVEGDDGEDLAIIATWYLQDRGNGGARHPDAEALLESQARASKLTQCATSPAVQGGEG